MDLRVRSDAAREMILKALILVALGDKNPMETEIVSRSLAVFSNFSLLNRGIDGVFGFLISPSTDFTHSATKSSSYICGNHTGNRPSSSYDTISGMRAWPIMLRGSGEYSFADNVDLRLCPSLSFLCCTREVGINISVSPCS